tara:strand:+ start:256 stop:507 length:252 start_codon:yes stop_codon:yes gene_type:complete
MRQKLITLDPASFAIAANMTNFSAFVRRATQATENGGLELVEPSQLSSTRMLSMLISREQKANGYETQVGEDLMKLLAHFRNI